MPLYGLIGNPIRFSFSKKYFNEKFAREGRDDFHYENFELDQIDELKDVLNSHKDLRGLNVTIPFKQSVLKYLDEQSSLVKECGACNCIRIEHGKLIGYNTDVTGFTESFKKQLRENDKYALVLGTGGASNAVCFGLSQLGIKYLLVSRSNQGNRIILYEEITPAIVEGYTIIINTTPLGSMSMKDQLPPLPYHLVNDSHYFYDLVYNPPRTLFLLEGEKRGARIKNGEEMLVIQAEESWHFWNQDSQDFKRI